MQRADPLCRNPVEPSRSVNADGPSIVATLRSCLARVPILRVAAGRFVRSLATGPCDPLWRRGLAACLTRSAAALLFACASAGFHGPASAQSSKEIDIWSGTVTVGSCDGSRGYSRWSEWDACQEFGELSDNSFTLDGVDHTIVALYVPGSSGTELYRGWFNILFHDEIRVARNLDARYFSVYTNGTVASRAVCSPRYWFGSDFSEQLCWPNAVLDPEDWRTGSTVEVKVTEIVYAPPAPTNLTATPNGSTRIDLSWAAPSNDGGSAITGYRIEVSTDAGATFELLAVTGATTTSYSHTGLPAGATRHYRISTISALVDRHQLTPSGATTHATTESARNAAPVFSEGASAVRSLAENAGPGQAVGLPLTATDGDDDPLTYSLSGTDADAFDVVPATGQIRTRPGVTYDYETKPSYFLVMSVADGQGASANILVTIDLVDVDEGPGGVPSPGKHRHRIPLVMSGDSIQQSFLRIINDSEHAGTVRIHGIDDDGRRFGPVALSLDALHTRHFNSGDLERGNPRKGMSGGIGDGKGHWRLELDTDLDIQPLAYIRTPEGFVTSMHDLVEGASMRWRVHFFNPASNIGRQSRLRVINASGIDTDVVIEGRDDRGQPAPGGEVRFSLPADTARMLTVRELERGYSAVTSDFEFEGRLGDGWNKWQLFVSANRPIQVMSLMRSGGGLLSNLSSAPADGVIRGSAGADELWGGNGNDVIDPGDNHEGFDVVHASAGDDRIVYTGSGPNGYQEINYSELDAGVTATIDGAANRGTVDKGDAGTDTIVDVANPLDAGGLPPYNGGFEIYGTPFDDVFHLALDKGQWMDVGGNEGDDTFNIESGDGEVVIDYGRAPQGVDVDLGAGRANDDGFGDVDTINGRVWGVAGSEHSDTIRGSDREEYFTGGAGDDDIDGGGGIDELLFGTSNPSYAAIFDIRDLEVDLGAGTATGTWNGKAFSYTLSNIETVRGGPGNDTLRGSDFGDILDGGGGDDELNPGDADGNDDEYDEIEGSAGNDRIILTEQSPPIWTGLHYSTLDAGITATIDGVANSATIDKGSAGTDTIVDVANPMNSWALGLTGTRFDDVFNVTVSDGQRLNLEGRAGNDTFNIQSTGWVRLQFDDAPAGIDIDLEAGLVNDDGFGDADAIHGVVNDVRCSGFTDVIRGSDNDETFQCLGGDDEIDGGGGFDRLRFDRWDGARNLIVDMAEGTATGMWNGKALSYKFSNIEHVTGGPGIDILIDSEGDDTLEGSGGLDLFVLTEGGDDTIVDFDDAEEDDVMVLSDNLIEDFGLTHYDVIDAARQDGPDVLIDLSAYDAGTIRLKHFDINLLSVGDILL